jgi:hypothetical protein
MDQTNTRVIQQSIFIWQSVFAIRIIRENSTPREYSTRLNVYVSLSEIANNNHSDEFDTFISSLEQKTYLDRHTISKHLKALQAMGLLELEEQTLDSKGKFTPINIKMLSEPTLPVVNEIATDIESHSQTTSHPTYHIKKHLLETSPRNISKKKNTKKIIKEKSISKVEEHKQALIQQITPEVTKKLKDKYPFLDVEGKILSFQSKSPSYLNKYTDAALTIDTWLRADEAKLEPAKQINILRDDSLVQFYQDLAGIAQNYSLGEVRRLCNQGKAVWNRRGFYERINRTWNTS